MTYEILETQDGKYALYVNGAHIADYTRKSTAKRGLERYLAARNLQLDLLTEAAPAPEAKEARTGAQTDSRAAAAGCAAVQPPPASNTGGTIAVDEVAVSRRESHYVSVNGKLKEIPLRAGYGTFAHIDTLTFTVHRSVFFADGQDDSDDIMLANIDAWLHEIFGFGLHLRGNGLQGYANSYVMGTGKKVKYGAVMWGGVKQRDTVCVTLYGMGCVAALDGWETRLYQWIQTDAPYANITRIDLAKDLFQGERTVMQVYTDWEAGLLDINGKRPNAEMAGAGWLNDPSKGKTLYVGSRKNASYLLRAYEKGIEQGDPLSPWVRLELQMRNRDIVIDHEILLEPGTYFLGRYPVFQTLLKGTKETGKKLEYVKSAQEANICHIMHYLSMQAAPAVKMLQGLDFDDSQIVRAILRPNTDYPKRLHPAAFDTRFLETRFVKQHKRRPYTNELCLYALELLETARHQQAPRVSKEQLEAFEQDLKQQLYLKAVFGRERYNPMLHDCDEEQFYHWRYGSIEPFLPHSPT